MRVLAPGLRATCSWRAGALAGPWRTCVRPPPGFASSPCSPPSSSPRLRPVRRRRPTARRDATGRRARLCGGYRGPGLPRPRRPRHAGRRRRGRPRRARPTDSPEDDLDDALRALAGATDADAAAAARAEALAILEGTPLPGRPYSGIPLLNWNAPAKVKTVPAGGTVDVREVRFPRPSLSDAWLLRFEDPRSPTRSATASASSGGTAGGELRPAAAAGRRRRTASARFPPRSTRCSRLHLATGTFDANRFTPQRGLSCPGGVAPRRAGGRGAACRAPA